MTDPFRNTAELIARVYSYVAYRIGEGADAEDITSAAFERALRYRSSFDGRRGDSVTWLIGIARRCIADAALRVEMPSDKLPDVEVAGHEDRAHARLDLAAALEALDPRDCELIALRYGGDLTAKQIAEVMDMKPNAVEVAIHRALARVRTELAEDVLTQPSHGVIRPAATDASAR